MTDKIFNQIKIFFPVILFLAALIFFSFFYRFHFHFIEQLQIFQFTGIYVAEYLKEPGFVSAILGDFLIQFYKLPFLGGFIVSVILFIIYLQLKSILKRFEITDNWFVLPMIPVILLFLLHSSINYRLPATVGILFSLAIFQLWILIKRYKVPATIVLIILGYLTCGTSILIFILVTICFELFQKKGVHSWLVSFVYLISFLIIVYIARSFIYIISWKEAFLQISYYDWRYDVPVLIYYALASFPAIIIIGILLTSGKRRGKKAAESKLYTVYQVIAILILLFVTLPDNISFKIEQNCRFDYEVRNKNWEKILEYAAKIDTIQPLNQPYINLALSHTGEMLNSLFDYSPKTINSLVPPKSENMVFNIICMEIYYHQGWTSLAQVHGIMANQETYRGRNVHCIQRLVEIEIVNGNYRLAEKYLDILEQTLFYKSWSDEKRKLLYNEDLIKKDDDYREVRKRLPKKDLLNGANIMVDLKQYLESNPSSKVAFEYMIAGLMLNKDNAGIVDLIQKQKGIRYADYPVLIQQVGMMYYLFKKGDENVIKQFNISNDVFNQFKSFYTFMDFNKNNPELAQNQMKTDFGNTYWYYLYFVK
ncbi:MAG: DUF6057 family protein [Bacteroidales bacterium]